METQLMLFDYNALDAETRIVVQQRTSEIKTLMRRTAQDIIDIGSKFEEIQTALYNKRPGFEAWYTAEGFKRSTVYRFINAYRTFGSSPNLGELAPSVMYILSDPSTPEPARTEAIERASMGEEITHSKAQSIVASYKPSPIYQPPNLPLYEAEISEPKIDTDDFDYDQPPRQTIDHETGEILPSEPIDDPQSIGRQKPKINRAANEYVAQGFDACQTPPYAVDPLIPYLDRSKTIWEPASGEGLLVGALRDSSFEVVTSDIINGQNFFDYEPMEQWDCIVTNPPYTLKYRWLERCYALGKPFALLLPVETLGAKTAQAMFKVYGLELILLDQRINFKMPNIGFEGSSAQFPVAWFTWGLNIGKELIFAEVKRRE